jgi:hypothetical protein
VTRSRVDPTAVRAIGITCALSARFDRNRRQPARLSDPIANPINAVAELLDVGIDRRLKSCVREMDTVSRFGGDEFVVLLSELTVDKAESTSHAKNIAEKIRITLEQPYLLTTRRAFIYRCTGFDPL